MNIVTYGARFYGGQIDRIDQGLRELGHRVNDFLGPPDLIYCNDMANSDNAFLKKANWPSAKLILNVLDVPSWVPDWKNIHDEWLGKLNGADKITCISQTVKKDIYNHFLINADVTYNPIKPVYPLGLKRDIFTLFVGRCNAPNKRVRELLWPLYNALIPYWGENAMHFIGNENPGFGVWHGTVSDEELNQIYNRSMFTLISSSFEGLNLPMIEGIITNAKPIICRDMSTALELGIPELLCDSTPESIFYKLKEVSENLDKYDKLCFNYAQKYSIQFSPKSIASNIVSVYNSL